MAFQRQSRIPSCQISSDICRLKMGPSGPLLLSVIILLAQFMPLSVQAMTNRERNELREESRDMFFHAYRAYMDNAYPADELMPLSCRGRYRGREQNRGDIDDALGNFSLTLIDSLDSLVIMGDLDEFEHGVKLVIKEVHFDHDIIVSVFETNIRVVGGLLAAHTLAEYLHDRMGRMDWYQGELLNMALDIGNRLLPAFNSSTGLPHPRVNLRHGIKAGKIKYVGETCTACAGTMILEFAALSRLSGEPIFEEKASIAMDVLWSSRNRMSNLVGNIVNINTGDWVRRDSGVGAGIDSYYEYVAKAYILLGEEKYLSRWNTHYSAVMKYLGQGPLMQDVHMHRPHSTSKHFVDALAAFWPGLQVLMGDLKPAIESHEVLYQIVKRHNFIPEAFTTDFQVHWGQHLLRPEFVESTYFLYRATGDHYYLDVGKKVLKSLQNHTRVVCGYATIKDVRTMQLEDRMDSFVLAETFKYLYLLFANPSDLVVDIENFVFTTEGHLLPLSLARLSNRTAVPLSKNISVVYDEDVEFDFACPSTNYLFPENKNFAESIRSPFANVVEEKCPAKPRTMKRKLLGADFVSTNEDHLKLVKDMGITIISLADGRVQLMHSFSNAKTQHDAEEGVLFMQEMIEMSKITSNEAETPSKLVTFEVGGIKKYLFAGPAQFGRQLLDGFSVTGRIVISNPKNGCKVSENGKQFFGSIVVIERGDCMFVEKARLAQSAGAHGAIVIDNNEGTTSANTPLFAMSGDGTDDVSIPVVFLFREEAKTLLNAIEAHPMLKVTLKDSLDKEAEKIPQHASTKQDSNKLFDLTSPVSEFLARSRQRVQQYFGGSVPSESSEEELVSNLRKIHEEMGHDGSKVKTTFKLSNGNTKTFVAVETLDENGEATHISVSELEEEMADSPDSGMPIETIEESTSDTLKRKFDFEIEDFLNPKSSSIRRLVEHHVLKNPNLLSEMLSLNFSDLLNVFQDLLVKKSSLEAAYLELFKILEEGGAEAIRKHSENVDNPVDVELTSKHSGNKLLKDVLNDDEIDTMIDQYLTLMDFDDDEQMESRARLKAFKKTPESSNKPLLPNQPNDEL